MDDTMVGCVSLLEILKLSETWIRWNVSLLKALDRRYSCLIFDQQCQCKYCTLGKCLCFYITIHGQTYVVSTNMKFHKLSQNIFFVVKPNQKCM